MAYGAAGAPTIIATATLWQRIQVASAGFDAAGEGALTLRPIGHRIGQGVPSRHCHPKCVGSVMHRKASVKSHPAHLRLCVERGNITLHYWHITLKVPHPLYHNIR